MLTSTRPIPLKIVTARRRPHGPGCGDVMREVEFRLAALAATGKRSTIDLCRRNLRPVEYGLLRLALAPGRVSAMVAAPQRCELRETIYPGVWWVTRYHDREDLPDAAIEVVFATEVIEIGYVPAIVGSTAKDVDLSLQRLRAIPQNRRPPALAGCGERRA
jgi:hydrogenase-1 operon protein HyaF